MKKQPFQFHGQKIIGIGKNYIKEDTDINALPKVPKIFLKGANALVEDGAPIRLTPMHLDPCDIIAEPELAFEISRGGKNIPLDEAMDHVSGYYMIFDVTDRRALKEDGGEYTRGKSADTFLPVSRELVSGIDPFHLAVRCFVNDKEVGRYNTENILFDIPHLITFISSFMTLEEGDIVLTGAPFGPSLYPGDRIRMEIDELGVLENPVELAISDCQ